MLCQTKNSLNFGLRIFFEVGGLAPVNFESRRETLFWGSDLKIVSAVIFKNNFTFI